MLTYTMDVEQRSIWLRTTPGETALTQPFWCSEAGLFYARDKFATSRSYKNSYLIFYTIAGEGYLRHGEREYRLTPGTCLLLDCRTPQSYGTAEGPAADSSRHLPQRGGASHRRVWHHYWIHADGPGVAALEPVINANGRPEPVAVPDTIREQFDSVLLHLSDENVRSALLLSLSVHHILTRMARSALLADNKAGDNRALMEMAAEYIRDHYDKPVSIDELLTVVPVSRSYFLRLFRQYIGTTPHNYLLRFRITQAKELLEMTDLPVAQIAERVGFGNECNFSTQFKANAGVTPAVYRKNSITARGRDSAAAPPARSL